MSETTKNQCQTLYPSTRTAYQPLTVKRQGILAASTYATHSDAYKRYFACCFAYVDYPTVSPITSSSDGNNETILISVMSVLAGLLSIAFIYRKKRQA